jgi:hypothetical protein
MYFARFSLWTIETHSLYKIGSVHQLTLNPPSGSPLTFFFQAVLHFESIFCFIRYQSLSVMLNLYSK